MRSGAPAPSPSASPPLRVAAKRGAEQSRAEGEEREEQLKLSFPSSPTSSLLVAAQQLVLFSFSFDSIRFVLISFRFVSFSRVKMKPSRSDAATPTRIVRPNARRVACDSLLSIPFRSVPFRHFDSHNLTVASRLAASPRVQWPALTNAFHSEFLSVSASRRVASRAVPFRSSLGDYEY